MIDFLINRIIWTQNNFPSYWFWFFLNPRWFYWFLPNPKGFDLLKEMFCFFFKSQEIWFFTLFSFNLMIGTHRDLMKQMFWFFFKSQGIWLIFLINRIIWTHTNFPSYLFWFFLNPRWFYWFFPNPKGFDLLKEMFCHSLGQQ